ncbi:sugar transporter [Tricharina praecox]|uniref:sugar transporter n=1 Tax=Tricharina praecox TaxID=43433 RepID=UPI00221EAA41|nr:sugar transporter [Tricharina praecox]KAI5849172.1 sugar transporter [Tricharina praecox]
MVRTWGNARGAALRIMVSVASSSAFLLFGYDQGVFAGLIGGSAFKDSFNNPDTTTIGTITAIYEIGCFLGAILTFYIGDRLGRKKAIWLGLAIMLVGTALQASAFGVAHMIVGRIVTGVGNGINTSTVPMYQAETTKARSRGRMISIEGWFITIGITISYWITYGTSFSEDATLQWRTPILLQVVFGAITAVMLFGLPESPRYLMANDQKEEALEVLAALEGEDKHSTEVQSQYRAIESALAANMANNNGVVVWRDYFKGGKQQTFRRLALGYCIQMMQQLTGINAVIFYSAYLLENVLSLDRELSLIVGGCTGLTFFVFTFIPILFIDNWGRRKPLMLGAAGQAIAMAVIAVCVKLSVEDNNKAAGTAGVVFVMVYIATYSGFAWVATPWLYPTEINELRFRNQGTALATSANWLWNFVVVKITPLGAENLGWKFFLIFMCFNAAFVPIIYFLYPETAGKTLEELDTLFHETTHAWKLTDKGSNPVPDLEAPMASGLSSDEDVSRKRASHSSIADEKL